MPSGHMCAHVGVHGKMQDLGGDLRKYVYGHIHICLNIGHTRTQIQVVFYSKITQKCNIQHVQ